MTPAKDNLQCRIAEFLLVCTKAAYTAINFIQVMLYVIGLSKPEVLGNIHKEEASSEKLATNIQVQWKPLSDRKCHHKKLN